MYVTKGGGGGVKRDFEKKIWWMIMRFQTNIWYANSKKLDGICF